MDAQYVTHLTKELIKLRKARDTFNAKALEVKGYPLWLIRQHGEFLHSKPLEIESMLKEIGVTNIDTLPVEKSPKNRKRQYRSKKPKNQ